MKEMVTVAVLNGCTIKADKKAIEFVKLNRDKYASVYNLMNDALRSNTSCHMEGVDEYGEYTSAEYGVKYGCVRALNFTIERQGKEYRSSVDYYTDGDTLMRILPIGDGKAMREDCRQRIMEELKIALGTDYTEDLDKGQFCSLWKLALKGGYATTPIATVPAARQATAPATANVVERVIERTVPAATPMEDMLRAAVMGVVEKVAADEVAPVIKQKLIDEFGFTPVVHEVRIADTKTTITDTVHEKFDITMFSVANNMPVYLYGPAGSGKNHMVEQIAEALKLDFYTMNCVTEEYKFNGFLDVNGVYHESEFYRAFTKGGIFFLDELDASSPDVLVNLNAAIANGYYPFPNGTKRAHENFRVVAAGNTLGTGADASYTGRNQLDAATLNRFTVIPVGYDERIDLMMAQGDTELVDFAKGYRAAAKKCGLATVCSYRNIKAIKVYEQAFPLETCLLNCLTKEMNKDDLNCMVSQFPVANRSNKYYNALMSVKPMD